MDEELNLFWWRSRENSKGSKESAWGSGRDGCDPAGGASRFPGGRGCNERWTSTWMGWCQTAKLIEYEGKKSALTVKELWTFGDFFLVNTNTHLEWEKKSQITNFKKASNFSYYNWQESSAVVLLSAWPTSSIVFRPVFSACSLFLQMIMAFAIIFLTFDGF